MAPEYYYRLKNKRYVSSKDNLHKCNNTKLLLKRVNAYDELLGISEIIIAKDLLKESNNCTTCLKENNNKPICMWHDTTCLPQTEKDICIASKEPGVFHLRLHHLHLPLLLYHLAHNLNQVQSVVKEHVQNVLLIMRLIYLNVVIVVKMILYRHQHLHLHQEQLQKIVYGKKIPVKILQINVIFLNYQINF